MARTPLPRRTSRQRRRKAMVVPRPGPAGGPRPETPRRRPPRPRPAGRRWLKLSLLLMALGLLWLSRGRWWPSPPPPQMILVLGGDKDREIRAADLARSRFAITTRRGGWDCLRHYEIAAAGAVPCFRQLEAKPARCAPHGLRPGSNCLSYHDWPDLRRQVAGITPEA